MLTSYLTPIMAIFYKINQEKEKTKKCLIGN